MAAGPGPRLPELLAAGRRLCEELEAGHEPSSGAPAVQEKVRQGLDALRRAAAMVAELDLFSENEELEEIASTDLQYLVLPALLGALTLKQVDLSKRLEHLESARAHFWAFLKLCKSYGLGSFQLPPASPSPPGEEGAGSQTPRGPQASLVAMASSRQAKIERYKQRKELENRLASMRTCVESGQADEAQTREFYILQTQRWISTSLEEIESIDQEMVILRSRGTAKQPPAPPHGAARPARPPLKPFLLTRDAAQAKVFGVGYPGLPTMTVDDWYEQRRRQGLSEQSTAQRAPGVADEEQQKQEQEKKEEEDDDEEALQKARSWDDWKDTHPRGYGNRQNMG
ncbi:immunoglobulin-binding protein 1 isoform X2 [Apus apus]|uniref:immunoglobulin-binding protein 1 isoform X2 n=1 Tax=Apus apus TaxID=8895 RepID=UPI0021F8FA95|nr:immunoglobulin-binding protein 1 isoform X2 [Apus apus]